MYQSAEAVPFLMEIELLKLEEVKIAKWNIVEGLHVK